MTLLELIKMLLDKAGPVLDSNPEVEVSFQSHGEFDSLNIQYVTLNENTLLIEIGSVY